MLSVRFEVGVSLLLAASRADKRAPKVPFLLVENAGIQPVIRRRIPTGAQRELGLTESTVVSFQRYEFYALLALQRLH